MISINYQMYGTKGFQLRLRFYQEGETKFIAVNRLLKGAIKRQHWNQRKQLFTPSCPFCDENNEILVQFKQKYQKMAIDWSGSVAGMLAAVEAEDMAPSDIPNVSGYIGVIVERLKRNKHPDGTGKDSHENYLKVDKRLSEYCKARNIRYDRLLITEVTAGFIDNVLNWVDSTRGGKGICYISKTLHSIVMKADKDGHLSSDDFRRCRWFKAPSGSSQKYHTLSEEQCRRFVEMDLGEICNSRFNELYRDFCLFILYTGQSACDAISLRYSDIKKIGGISHFVFKRRKIAEKQTVPCAVPINERLEEIMKKWKWRTKDGYVLPIRTKEKIRTQGTSNGDIKHFIGNLNNWLKRVGKALGCAFPLRTYVFRHTAITRYISKGVPVVYVANMMGTSVDNCQTIYYNNQGDTASRDKVLTAMRL